MSIIKNNVTWADSLDMLPPHATRDLFGARIIWHVALVQRVLQSDPTALTRVDESGNSPLHWAAFRNTPECVKLLLDNGASVNAVNATEGASVLHWAAIAGDVRIVHCSSRRAPTCIKSTSAATTLCCTPRSTIDCWWSTMCLVLACRSIQSITTATLRCIGPPTRACPISVAFSSAAAPPSMRATTPATRRCAGRSSRARANRARAAAARRRSLARRHRGAVPLQTAQQLKHDAIVDLLQHDLEQRKRTQRAPSASGWLWSARSSP
jgi:hypothetical protein